ncbi:hypothetical protein ACWGH2_44145 [Streptomyces sp. NPDC054871]
MPNGDEQDLFALKVGELYVMAHHVVHALHERHRRIAQRQRR